MNISYVANYIEANAVCVVILLIVLSNELRNPNRAEHRIVFSNTVVFHILYFAVDSVWILVDGNVIPRNQVSLAIVNYCVTTLTEACTFFWYLYAETYAGNPRLSSVRSRVRAAVPLFVILLIVLIRFLTGHVYYLTEEGRMTHPFLYYTTLVLPFGYLLFTSYRCVLRGRDKDHYADRSVYFALAVYPLVLFVFGVVQLFWQHLPTLCYGATITVVYVYILALNNMVSTDPLTQLNNRNQLNRYMQTMDRERAQDFNTRFYIMMIDVNHFKTINDTYGHTAGDRALVTIARVLKEVCGMISDNRPFLARYGGDEFLIAVQADRSAEIEEIAERIYRTLEQVNAASEEPFRLSLSIGWAGADQGMLLRECVARADEAMYREKQKAHASRD